MAEGVALQFRRRSYDAHVIEGFMDDHGWHPVTFEILLPPGVRISDYEGPRRPHNNFDIKTKTGTMMMPVL